jgi:Asp-tRNA(Asn)/Glu-tRNA(Gln) amidotransferase C subunit
MTAVAEVNLKTIPAKPASSWHQRSLSTKCARTPYEKRSAIQKAGSLTVGQLIGSFVAAVGVGDFIYKMFYSDSDSIWNKYITPLLITFLGVSGAASSPSPSNVLGVDVISSGVNIVTDKLKNLDDISLLRFSIDSKKKIMKSLNKIVSSLTNVDRLKTTKLLDLYQQFSQGSSLSNDLENGESLSVDQIEQRIRAAWEMNCSPQSKRLGADYNDLFNGLNEGLQNLDVFFDHQYDKRRGLVNLYVNSANVFSSPHDSNVNFQPFILLTFTPESFKKAMIELNKEFIAMGLPGNETTNQDKEIVQSLIQSLCHFISFAKSGYFEVDKNSNNALRRYFVDENIEQFLSRKNREFLGNFFNSSNVVADFEVSAVESETNPHILRMSGISSLEDVLKCIGGEDFTINNNDSNEVKALKYSYSWLWISKEGVLLDKQTHEAIDKEIQKALGTLLPSAEYKIIKGFIQRLEIPEKYLNIDLLLEALQVKSTESQPFSNETCETIYEIIDILGETQQAFVREAFSKRFPDWDKASTA